MPVQTKEHYAINRMKAEHLQEVIDIEAECFLSPWSLEDYGKELEREDSISLIATDGKKIIGFIIMRLTASEEAEVYNFAVRENYRQMGVGTKLLREALDQATQTCDTISVWLEVRESNRSAIKFYKKNGFIIIGHRKNFYTNPVENAVLMKLERGTEKCRQ